MFDPDVFGLDMFGPDVFGPVDRMDFDSLAQEVQAVDRSQADSLEIDSPDFDSLAIGNPDFETVDRQTLAQPAQAAGFPTLADARTNGVQRDCASAARLDLVLVLGPVLVLTAELARPPLEHID